MHDLEATLGDFLSRILLSAMIYTVECRPMTFRRTLSSVILHLPTRGEFEKKGRGAAVLLDPFGPCLRNASQKVLSARRADARVSML